MLHDFLEHVQVDEFAGAVVWVFVGVVHALVHFRLDERNLEERVDDAVFVVLDVVCVDVHVRRFANGVVLVEAVVAGGRQPQVHKPVVRVDVDVLVDALSHEHVQILQRPELHVGFLGELVEEVKLVEPKLERQRLHERDVLDGDVILGIFQVAGLRKRPRREHEKRNERVQRARGVEPARHHHHVAHVIRKAAVVVGAVGGKERRHEKRPEKKLAVVVDGVGVSGEEQPRKHGESVAEFGLVDFEQLAGILHRRGPRQDVLARVDRERVLETERRNRVNVDGLVWRIFGQGCRQQRRGHRSTCSTQNRHKLRHQLGFAADHAVHRAVQQPHLA